LSSSYGWLEFICIEVSQILHFSSAANTVILSCFFALFASSARPPCDLFPNRAGISISVSATPLHPSNIHCFTASIARNKQLIDCSVAVGSLCLLVEEPTFADPL
jgi:hypothetical protein